MTIGNFNLSFEGVSTDLERNKDYYRFVVSRFDEKGAYLGEKVFYFTFKPHFKPEDLELIMDLYKLPNYSRIAGAHVAFARSRTDSAHIVFDVECDFNQLPID